MLFRSSTIQQRKELLKGKNSAITSSRLRRLRDELEDARTAAKKIHERGSGRIVVDAADTDMESQIENPMEVDNPIATASMGIPHDDGHVTPAQPSFNASHHSDNMMPLSVPNTFAPTPSVETIKIKMFVPNIEKWYG